MLCMHINDMLVCLIFGCGLYCLQCIHVKCELHLNYKIYLKHLIWGHKVANLYTYLYIYENIGKSTYTIFRNVMPHKEKCLKYSFCSIYVI